MSKKRKAVLAAFLISVSALLGLSGCSSKPHKLIKTMNKNMKEIHSFSNSVKMEIKMERLSRVTEVSMDMKLKNTTKPQAGHAIGTANVNVRGNRISSEMEIYQVIEDGIYVTYSGVDKVWTKETSETKRTSGTVIGENWFHDMGTEMDTFRVADEPVEVAGKECYEMYGDVTGEYLMGFLGEDMLHAYGLVELPEDASIAELVIPVTFDVYKEDVLPARMIVDMTDVMNNLYDEYGKSTNVNDFTVELGFESYNDVDEIIVPPEVRGAALDAKTAVNENAAGGDPLEGTEVYGE